MDVLSIQKSYRKIIARFIINERALTQPTVTGSREITIVSTRRYQVGDKIALLNQATMDVEFHLINDILDSRTLQTSHDISDIYPVTSNESTTSVVRKAIGDGSGTDAFIQAIYLGDPPVISHYPAITIDMKSRSSEWMTLESTKEKYNIDISIYVLASEYENQYELMMHYTNAIETALFRSFYPLVDPYTSSTLTNDITPEDVLFSVDDTADGYFCRGQWIWFESIDYLRHNKIHDALGSGVYQTVFPISQDFSVGDTVIRPTRHIFNTLPESTQFGVVNKESMLRVSRISLLCEEEVKRHTPFIDSLTF